MLSGATKNLTRQLETRLKLVKGILNTKQRMFVASRSALLFANNYPEFSGSRIRGILHSNLRKSFQDLIEAKAVMIDLSKIDFKVLNRLGLSILKKRLSLFSMITVL